MHSQEQPEWHSTAKVAWSGCCGCSPGSILVKGQVWGGRSQHRSDDRRQRPARSKAAADGLLCGTEECLCWQVSL